MMIHNCSECDYCYTNDTMDCMSICVNGKSEMLGQVVDSYGMAEDDMDCVVIDGKDRDEIDQEDAEAHWDATLHQPIGYPSPYPSTDG